MYKDWRGTPIEIGCHVVYPSRISSSLYVHEGVVDDWDQMWEALTK